MAFHDLKWPLRAGRGSKKEAKRYSSVSTTSWYGSPEDLTADSASKSSEDVRIYLEDQSLR